MKNNCHIVEDLLPLYAEDIASEDSVQFLEEHLQNCDSCRRKLEQMKKIENFDMNVNAVPLKSLKEQLFKEKRQSIIFTTVLVLLVTAVVFSVLTAYKYFPYSKDILTVKDNQDNVNIIFQDKVRGYMVDQRDEAGGTVYNIAAWTTTLDQLSLAARNPMSFVIEKDRPVSVYYIQDNGKPDVLVYGQNLTGQSGKVTLPRLTLGYYLAIAAVLASILGFRVVLYWKDTKVRERLLCMFSLPFSYICAHFAMKQFDISSFNLLGDLGRIILVTIILFIALCVLIRINVRKNELIQ